MNLFIHLSAIDTLIIPDVNWGFANVNAAAARQSEKKVSAERAAGKVFLARCLSVHSGVTAISIVLASLIGDISSYDISSQKTDCPVVAGDVLSPVGGHGRLVGGELGPQMAQ